MGGRGRIAKTNAIPKKRSREGLVALPFILLWAALLAAEQITLAAFARPEGFFGYDFFTESFFASQSFLLLTGGFLLLRILLFVPLFAGAKRWFFEKERGRTPFLFELFFFFYSPAELFRLFSLRIRSAFLQLVFAAFLFVPLWLIRWGIAELLGYMGFFAALTRLILTCCFLLLLVVGTALLSFYQTRYFLADYLLFFYPGLCPSEALRLSFEITKGRRNRLFSQKLSLFPLVLLSLPVIPLLFTLPRIYSGFSVSAWALIKNHPLYY